MADSQNGPQAKHFTAMKKPMFPPGTFNGKSAFITGGGTGLGRCIALFLSNLGAQVAIASRKLPGIIMCVTLPSSYIFYILNI